MARKKRGRPRGMPAKPRRRQSFVFMAHWYDTIDVLPDDCQLEIYQILVRYALTGIEPSSMSLTARSVLMMAKPNIDPDLDLWRGHRAADLRGNPNFRTGHANPYLEKIKKTIAQQYEEPKELEEE